MWKKIWIMQINVYFLSILLSIVSLTYARTIGGNSIKFHSLSHLEVHMDVRNLHTASIATTTTTVSRERMSHFHGSVVYNAGTSTINYCAIILSWSCNSINISTTCFTMVYVHVCTVDVDRKWQMCVCDVWMCSHIHVCMIELEIDQESGV